MKTSKLLFKAMLTILIPVAVCGQTWVPQTSGTTANLWAVHFLNADEGYACGDAGVVVKTTNGGTTWTSANITTTSPVNDVYFISANEGWAAVGDANNPSSTGQIWHTINGGTTWTPQTPSTTEARFGVSFASATVGWEVGSRNGPINIDATTDGGTKWLQQTNSNIFGWLYKVDAISTTSAVVIGGAFFPAVSGFIIKTTNGGSTWTQPTTGTIPFLNGLDMATATVGFVVGDGGYIMKTADGGSTWTTQTSGIPDTLQDVSFATASVGWICGFDGAIRRTINGGTNWGGETAGVTQNLNGIHAIDTTTAWAVGDAGKIIKRTLSTGISGVKAFNYNITIYPNPFSTFTTISFDAPSGSESFSLVIYDIAGREVKRVEDILFSKIILSKENLSAGFYNYSLLNKEKSTVASGKMIIN